MNLREWQNCSLYLNPLFLMILDVLFLMILDVLSIMVIKIGLNNSTYILVYTHFLQHCVNSRRTFMHFWIRKVQKPVFFFYFICSSQQKCVFIYVIFHKRNYRFYFFTDFIVMSISNKRQSGISVKRTKWTKECDCF